MSAIVTIQGTGERFTVAAGETILQDALRQGVLLPHGCYNGVCDACISRIVSGAIDCPDGPPLALFEEDAGKGLCCVGLLRGDLVIEPEHLGRAVSPGI